MAGGVTRRPFLQLLGLAALTPASGFNHTKRWQLGLLFSRHGAAATAMVVSTFEDDLSPPTGVARWSTSRMTSRAMEARAKAAVGPARSYEVELVFDPPIEDRKRGRRLASVSERVLSG